MSVLRRLVGGAGARGTGSDAEALEAIAAATERVRRELRALRDEVGDLGAQIAATQDHMARLDALREGDRDVAVRLDRLERVLDAARVAAHVGAAVARAEIAGGPVPHAILSDLLPGDAYAAILDAVPPRIFFERRGGAHVIRVPPALAPTHCIVTWSFMRDVAGEALVAAVVERFAAPLGRLLRTRFPHARGMTDAGLRLVASQSRIVLEPDGDTVRPRDVGAWDWLTVAVALRPGANSAVVSMPSAAGAEPPMPSRERVDDGGYPRWEFVITPDKKTRRALEPDDTEVVGSASRPTNR